MAKKDKGLLDIIFAIFKSNTKKTDKSKSKSSTDKQDDSIGYIKQISALIVAVTGLIVAIGGNQIAKLIDEVNLIRAIEALVALALAISIAAITFWAYKEPKKLKEAATIIRKQSVLIVALSAGFVVMFYLANKINEGFWTANLLTEAIFYGIIVALVGALIHLVARFLMKENGLLDMLKSWYNNRHKISQIIILGIISVFLALFMTVIFKHPASMLWDTISAPPTYVQESLSVAFSYAKKILAAGKIDLTSTKSRLFLLFWFVLAVAIFILIYRTENSTPQKRTQTTNKQMRSKSGKSKTQTKKS